MMICNCGRTIGKLPHCTNCGSTNVYAVRYASRIVTIEDEVEGKKKILLQGFKCRRCATIFCIGDKCEAPPSRHNVVDSVERLPELSFGETSERTERLRKLFEKKEDKIQ